VNALSANRAWVVAFVAAMAVAIAVVVAQPIGSPWWTYADADATYTSSSLNLLVGLPTRYLDHPGLPIEELGTVAFGAEYLADRATGTKKTRHEFIDEKMLNLDRARPVFRGLAAAIYLLGAALSFLLLGRLFRHWVWGLTGALLWIGAPGLVAMSIQFRPDVALSVLILVFAYLVGRAMDTRSPWTFMLAGVTLGFATMVKMHAAGAVPALVLAALLRPSARDWSRRALPDLRAFLVARRLWLAAAAAVWLALAVVLNSIRQTFDWSARPVTLGVVVLALAVGGIAVAMLVPRLAGLGLAAFGFQAGLAIPISFNIPDGLQSLVEIRSGLSGGGVNTSIPLFSMPLHLLVESPLKEALFIFVLAGVAALVGIARRDPKPVVWFVGAAALGVMAAARLGALHYFAPAYVLSVPGALWLLRGRPALGVVAACVVVWYSAWPAWQKREAPERDAARFAALVAPGEAWLDTHLSPHEVALVPEYWPLADVRFFGLVRGWVAYTPPYPYRELEATRFGNLYAASHGYFPRYYLGPAADSVRGNKITIEAGTFVVQPVAPLVVRLLSGPGVDKPWNQPNAKYDVWTGYFIDRYKHYWAWEGQQVFNPPRRRYLAREHLWVDAFGDLWNAKGKHMGNRPDLRTAP
jgi:hypothetical protein